MKINILNTCIIFMFYCSNSYGMQNTLANKLSNQAIVTSTSDATISFIFNNEDLVDIINMCAELKGVNIVLPTGANAINTKITLTIPHKLTVQEAWDILHIILDIAGYSIVPKGNLYVIVKNSKNISREPFPLYINTPVSELPNTDERIRYVFYLQNIKASQEFDNQLNALFKEFMPEDAILKADKIANSILIIAKSQDIKGFIHIIKSLDETGFQESIEVIPLRYTQAETIAQLFTENLLKADVSSSNKYHLDTKKEQAANYFSSNVKVIAEPRTNSLIILGRLQAIERIKDFIFKHLDREPESGKSILHVYGLQYLDAEEFAPVLRNIVTSSHSGGTGQSKAGAPQSSTERLFDQVIVQTDSPAEASSESEEGKYFGGNKLIIAARNDDWKRIKILIEKLDKPQPQVIIEVLIADLTLEDSRSLGSLLRNPGSIPFAGNASLQAAMVDQTVLDKRSTSADPNALNSLTGVASDLNAITVPSLADSSAIVSIPNNLAPGTTALSINDSNGRTWNILELLQLFTNTKVLSHPHIIATNNQKATIEVGETRLVIDQAAPSTSGITVRKKELKANINVYITPRISSADTVNLQVVIDIDQFTDPNNFESGDRINRDVVTNATVKSGDILALGGLLEEDTADTIVRTPILSEIPILGWFFKRKDKIINQTSLTVFISPMIIQPKLRGGIGEYTKAYVGVAKSYSTQSGLFDNLRDPITRWFFPSDIESSTITDNFLEKDEVTEALHPDLDIAEQGIEEQERLDQAPIDTTTALKEFLVHEENPLTISNTQNNQRSANACNPQANNRPKLPLNATLPKQNVPAFAQKKDQLNQKESSTCNVQKPNRALTYAKMHDNKKTCAPMIKNRSATSSSKNRTHTHSASYPNEANKQADSKKPVQSLMRSYNSLTKPTSNMDNLREMLVGENPLTSKQ